MSINPLEKENNVNTQF